MEEKRQCCPGFFHLDETLFQILYGWLDYGEDLDDLLFYGEAYAVSER